jgi:hypothetical protein
MVFWILVGQDNDAVAPVTIILRIVYWRSEIKRKIDKSYDINGSLEKHVPIEHHPQKKMDVISSRYQTSS